MPGEFFPNYHNPISRRAFLGSIAAGGVSIALTRSTLAAASTDSVAAQYPHIAALIADYVSSGKVSGMVAALGWHQDVPQFLSRGATAFAHGRPVGPDTLYRIYSMTKPITGMAAMICVDEGLLKLDQPIAELIPAFAHMQVQKVYDGPITPDNLEPAVRPITLRECLTHTAGLGYSIVQKGPIAQAYRQQGLVPGEVSRILMPGVFGGKPVDSLTEFAQRLATMPLVYQPGTHWSYSVGLDLVGRLIEIASGVPFATFLQQRLFDPLGMASTFFQVPQSDVDRLTANYFVLDGTLLPIDLPHDSVFLEKPPFAFGGSGLVSSARDYDRFLQMIAGYGLFNGKRVMSEAAVRLGTSDLMPATVLPGDGFHFAGRKLGFGAGGMVGMGDAKGLYGWSGMAGTNGYVNLDWGFRYTLMTQYMPPDAYPLTRQLPFAAAADARKLMQQS